VAGDVVTLDKEDSGTSGGYRGAKRTGFDGYTITAGARQQHPVMHGHRKDTMKRSSLDRRTFLSLSANAAALSLTCPASLAAARSLPTDELTALTLQEAAARIRSRAVSPVELTKACLARIERYDTKINAFITVSAELALAEARAAEQEIGRGRWRGPLHGIPLALKDNIDTAGIRTTAASDAFKDRVPAEDAEVVRRLRRAGAVILGKLNMWEFATSPESAWGPVHNPWELEYEAGGSSSGSGAALAAEFCFGTLGTDTAGSIRFPAHCCGVVGLKPTYGLVSNSGVIPAMVSVDHVGPLARSVVDAALLLQSMAGYDPSWGGSANVKLPDYVTALHENRRSFGLGIPRAGCFEMLDPEVAQVVGSAVETMSTIGAIRSEAVVVPRYLDIFGPLGAEMLAYHAPLFAKAAERYQPMLRDRFASDFKQCVSGIEYVNALRALQDTRRRAAEIFPDEVDLLILPTWKRLPMTIAERQKTPFPEEFAQELWNTLPFNVLGLPALSLPCGYTKSGLPVGVQIVGRPFAEAQVFAFAQAYEQATQWHSRKPKV
jgi:aspartyl-tRNA(Asn)/glutamyl-tRNA(Gln) amidotransferase subunit A